MDVQILVRIYFFIRGGFPPYSLARPFKGTHQESKIHRRKLKETLMNFVSFGRDYVFYINLAAFPYKYIAAAIYF